MNKGGPEIILRNLAAIPVAIVVAWIGEWFLEFKVMEMLQGDDPHATKFFFIIPIKPVADWVIPFVQSLLVPGITVVVASGVAASRKTGFAVATGVFMSITLVVMTVAVTYHSTLPGMTIFRLWLWTVVSLASVLFSIACVTSDNPVAADRTHS